MRMRHKSFESAHVDDYAIEGFLAANPDIDIRFIKQSECVSGADFNVTITIWYEDPSPEEGENTL